MPFAFELAAIERRIAALDPPPAPAPAANSAAFAQLLDAGGASGPQLPTGAPVAPAAIDAMIAASASKYGVDPGLVRAVVSQESGFDTYATSKVGAQGLMQLMPETAAGLGVADPYDAAQNVDGGTKYLRQLLDRFGGDTRRAVAAYNAGPAAVERYDGVPPYAETQNYVASVLAGYARTNTMRT